MWQAINPNTYVTRQPATDSTVTTAAGTEENVQTSLTPFWKNPSDFFDSEEVRRTETFGHAYPETQAWNFPSAQAYQSSVRAAFRQLYGGSSLGFILANSQRGRLSDQAQIQPPPARSASILESPLRALTSISASVASAVKPKQAGDQKPLKGDEAPHDASEPSEEPSQDDQKPKGQSKDDQKPRDENDGNRNPPDENKKTGEASDQPPKDDQKAERNIQDIAPHGKYLEWIVNLKVQKHALGGTFLVHVFLGDFPRDDPTAWLSAPNKVGALTVLGDSPDTGCLKCEADRVAHLQITGQVPLTLGLVERYLAHQIDDLTPEKVVPYLQTNLHWRVTLVNGIPDRSFLHLNDLTPTF